MGAAIDGAQKQVADFGNKWGDIIGGTGRTSLPTTAPLKGSTSLLLGPKISWNLKPDAPPPAPDLTDEAVQTSKRNQLFSLVSGRGRGSTFLNGPMGDPAAPVLDKKKAY